MNARRPGTVRIVILGGGYVAIWAYRSLVKRLKRAMNDGTVTLTVICPMNYHSFHGWTGESLGGIVDLANKLSELRRLLPEARLVCGEAVEVDLRARTVRARLVGEGLEETFGYEHLLFANGSRDDDNLVPGCADHGWPMKGIGDELAVRNHLSNLLEQADATSDPEARDRFLSIVVAGGGFAGVEMTAAIAELFRVLRDRYPVLRRHRPRLTLVEGGDALLPSLRPRFDKLADYATEQLLDYGVDLRLETKLLEVSPAGALLSDGDFIPSAMVISTVGQRLVTLAGTESLSRDKHGRLHLDERLRVKGWPNLWAGGDTANVIHPDTRIPCPPNALWAIKHGERVGDNIARCILGKELLPFTYPGLGQVASLGIGKGAAEVYGLQFTGWPGWLMRMGFFLWFMPAKDKALRVSLDWLTLPLTGRRVGPLFHTPLDRSRPARAPEVVHSRDEGAPVKELRGAGGHDG